MIFHFEMNRCMSHGWMIEFQIEISSFLHNSNSINNNQIAADSADDVENGIGIDFINLF